MPMKAQKAFYIQTIKFFTIMRKKIFGVAVIAALAGVAVYNFSLNQTVDEVSDLTLENLDAIATARGYFPACQKEEGTRDSDFIPFCVNGVCEESYQPKGTLDVNYCNE